MKIVDKSELRKLIEKLENQLNIKIYLVGGAVRDFLLNKGIKDYDFTTPSTPEEVESSIRKIGKKPYLIGKKFGTVGFKFEINGKTEYIEITTFREEVYSSKNRKPEVAFTSNLQADLSRRDFTINALAMNKEGKLIDDFDGLKDLENGKIKAVGNPKIRFKEDPLRILRAIRFANNLDFEIEDKTYQKMQNMKMEILNISKERWVMEIDKILSSANPEKGLNLLMNSGIFSVMIPELSLQYNYNQNSPYHQFDLWTHTKKVVCNIPPDNLNLRWTALFHDIAKPFVRSENKNGYSNYLGHEILGAEMARKICAYLKFSNARTDYICKTIKGHMLENSELKPYDDKSKGVKNINKN